MKNHYTKVKNTVDFKIYNELESFIYNSLVEDELTSEEQSELHGFKRTFINAKMLKEEGEEWD